MIKLDPSANELWRRIGVAAIIALLVIPLFGLPLRPVPSLYGAPLVDDGFYVLSVARRIGMGQGVTIDGHRLTNGFQPLWVFINSILYWLTSGDRAWGLRLVQVVTCVLTLTTAWLLGRIAERALPWRDMPELSRTVRWVAPLLYLASDRVIGLSFSGLETPLVFAMYAVVGWYCLGMDGTSTRQKVVLGILCGLLVLTRIDAGFFVVLISVAEFRHRQLGLWQRCRGFLIISTIAATVSAPWWIYNLWEFGALMPTSGAALEDGPAFVGARWTALIRAWSSDLVVPFAADGYARSAVAGYVQVEREVLFLALGAAIIGYTIKSRRNIRRLVLDYIGGHGQFCVFVICFFGTMVICSLYYAVMSFASYFYFRYLGPLCLVGLVLMSWVIARALYSRSLVVLALIVCVMVPRMIVGWGMLTTKNSMTATEPASPASFLQQYALVQRYVPAAATVGAFQSGTLGYLRDNVVNLDGVVNASAVQYRGRIDQYVKDQKIDWLADWALDFIWPNPDFQRIAILQPNLWGTTDFRAEWDVVAAADRDLTSINPACETCYWVVLHRRGAPMN